MGETFYSREISYFAGVLKISKHTKTKILLLLIICPPLVYYLQIYLNIVWRRIVIMKEKKK